MNSNSMEFSKAELIAVVGGMVTVISALWVMLNTHLKRDTERLKKYELLHEKNHEQIIELTGDHRELKGRIDTIERVNAKIETIEQLSLSVLEAVKKQ